MHLIIFDIDGTLLRTNELDDRLFAQAMHEYLGVEIDTDWAHYRNVTDTGIAEELFEKHNRLMSDIAIVQQRFVSLVKEAIDKEPAYCPQIAGVGDFLNLLHERPDVAIGIATGGWGDSAWAKLQCAKINLEGIAFASSDDSNSRTEIMLISKQRASSISKTERFESITYFGDGTWDVKASVALGWNFIGIGEGSKGDRLRSQGANYLFKDYSGSNKSSMLQTIGIDSR